MRSSVFLLVLASSLSWSQARIVSLTSPVAEMIYTLGAQDRLLGVTDVCVFPAQILEDRRSGKIRELGPFASPDLQKIDSVQPDVIFTSTGFQKTLAERLRAKGYRVIHFEPQSLDEIVHEIEQVGEAIGRKKQALQVTRTMRTELAEITGKSSSLPRVRVYLEINHEGPWTAGVKSPLNDLIRAAGGENIFADKQDGVFVTNHAEIVRRNPEIILSPIWVNAKVGGIDGIIPLAEIFARPGYGAITAVKNSRVLYYDSALLKHEGPRQILAIRKLAQLLHPEAFPVPPGTIPWELGRIRP
jgi:iron complex transport system substrate-binding protein